MIIAFHTNQINLLGVEVSIYDYADYCEKLLGHKAIIISSGKNRVKENASSHANQPLAIQKFKNRFPLYLYQEISDIDKILMDQKVDLFYAQKRGDYDEIESKNVRTVIHSVFKKNEPHGDVYAYISKWLSMEMTQGASPYVPYMINLPKVDGDLRSALAIPNDAIVMGRYGGMDSFNIDFVHESIIKTANDNPNFHFLLMNTRNFLNQEKKIIDKIKTRLYPRIHKQIHFLPPTASLGFKSQFINSCDAMLHARDRGETFGAAIAEFSSHNCPVITFAGNGKKDYESAHIDMLEDKCFLYNNKEDLNSIFEEFNFKLNLIKKKNWDAYSIKFSPKNVMEKFNKVFII